MMLGKRFDESKAWGESPVGSVREHRLLVKDTFHSQLWLLLYSKRGRSQQ